MVKFNVLMGKHLNVVGVLQEDLSLVGAVCQNHGKGTVNWKGRLDTHKGWNQMCLKKLSNYSYLDATYLLKPRLTVNVAFLRKHINSRVKALNRQDLLNTGFTMASQALFFLGSSDWKESKHYCSP